MNVGIEVRNVVPHCPELEEFKFGEEFSSTDVGAQEHRAGMEQLTDHEA